MDLRVKNVLPIRRIPSPEDGLRALAQKAPQAEALLGLWIEPLRPLAASIYALRRRIATIVVGLSAVLLFVHVMFGANGMVIYKQKRLEYETLQKQITEARAENEAYQSKIRALKTDARAIEKEAREKLRYARPGEFVYVPPSPPDPTPPARNTAKK
jgi:cell division protein FtsB